MKWLFDRAHLEAAGFRYWRLLSGQGSAGQKLEPKIGLTCVLDRDRLGELEDILKRFKAKTTQEAIFLEVEHDVDLRLI